MTNPSTASLIARMGQVEWTTLDYAYGDPCDVSALIQTIVSENDANASEACASLHEQLVHQASIYSSTYEAIPFLIEALALTQDKPHTCLAVLNLLDDIADSCLHAIERERNSEERWQPSDKWIRRVWRGSELFVRMLQDDKDPDVRAGVAHLLGVLVTLGPSAVPSEMPGQYIAVVGALVAALESHASDPAPPSVIFAIGQAAKHDLSLIGRLRDAVVRRDLKDESRVAAALSIVEIERGKYANLEEVDLLVDTMCWAADPHGKAMRTVRIGAGSRARLSTSLCDWSTGDLARMERVLPALVAGISLASGYTPESDLHPAFQWLWPDRRPRFADSKSLAWVWPPAITPADVGSIARQVIEACCDNPGIWKPATGNTTLVFRHFGLPETRQGLKELLERSQ